ncbi:unnamed protein product [Dicrocoelium dendriticum]|nr:unnamed protein product [Dicrocoelium dendriticum]
MNSGCVFLVYLTLICVITAFESVVKLQYDNNGKPFVYFSGRRYYQTGDKTVTYIDSADCITTVYLDWPAVPENIGANMRLIGRYLLEANLSV